MEIVDKEGNNALHLAAHNGQASVIKALLASKADITK